MSRLLRKVMFVAGVAALASACDPYVESTVVELRDPSVVQYTTSLGHPIGVNGKPVVVSDDDIRYRGNHIAEMIVTAQPAPDGSLVTSWQTDADILRHQTSVTFHPAATTTLAGDDAITLSTDTLSYPVCGAHHDSGIGRHGGENFALVLSSSCNARKNDFQVTATTPMWNVRGVRHEYAADPGRSVAAALAVTILATGAASFLMLAPAHPGGKPSVGAQDAGDVVLVLGAAIDIGILLPAIFAHDHEEVIYEGPRLR